MTDQRSIRPIACLTGKANGKPNTDLDYYKQGQDARTADYAESDCPYYSSSTAETYWKRGYRGEPLRRVRVGDVFGNPRGWMTGR
jgi:hypothetical protein